MIYRYMHDIPQQEFEDNLREIVNHARPFECEKLAASRLADFQAIGVECFGFGASSSSSDRSSTVRSPWF